MCTCLHLEFPLRADAPMVDVVPEAKAVLQEVLVIAQDKMVLHYNEDVKSKLYVYQLSGAFIHALELPVGSVSEMSGERKYDHFLFSITSFDTPKVIYDVDVSGGTYDVSVLRRTNVSTYTSAYVFGTICLLCLCSFSHVEYVSVGRSCSSSSSRRCPYCRYCSNKAICDCCKEQDS